MTTWLLSLFEVKDLIEKTPAATKVWLHRHGIKATRRVSVGERATWALYDGATVTTHMRLEIPVCPGCVAGRRGRKMRA